MSNFNPTVIRHRQINNAVGMVIAGNGGDDFYMQVYSTFGGRTNLVYSMPWSHPQKACDDFAAWRKCATEGEAMPYAHSWTSPEESK